MQLNTVSPADIYVSNVVTAGQVEYEICYVKKNIKADCSGCVTGVEWWGVPCSDSPLRKFTFSKPRFKTEPRGNL